MLTIKTKPVHLYDEANEKFIDIEQEYTLMLEHSLVSLSKWEQKWEKPFLGPGANTRSDEEAIDYIRCMCLNPEDIPDLVFQSMTQELQNQIGDYINKSMTATWFNDPPGNRRASGEVITAEIIYYWLVAQRIPFEVQYWHLNRLLTLIRVVNIKSDPKKKMMPRADQAQKQRMLNEQRLRQLGTKG